jgi:uncharacterized protein
MPLKRIDTLDVLRGIALLGIFFMNIEFFNRSILEMGIAPPAVDGATDIVFARVIELCVTGKFWILFSLLFGMGFVVMKTQAAKNQRAFIPLYLRRCIALLVFGLLHTAFLWPGDILHTYAIAACIFMLVPEIPAKYSIAFGVVLSMVMPLMSIFSGGVAMLQPELMAKQLGEVASELHVLSSKAAAVYQHGSYHEVTLQRIADFSELLGNELYVVMMALGFFFIGAGIMRSGVLLDTAKYRRILIVYGLLCGTVGALLILFSQSIHTYEPLTGKGLLYQGVMMLGNLPLALAYLCLIAIAMSYATIARLLKIFAPAGKMALSNYLLQSVVASTVFFGYGLGYWGQWGRSSLVLFVIVVYATQVVCSKLWLRYFNYGPMEWIWRAITYMQLPDMKKFSAAENS